MNEYHLRAGGSTSAGSGGARRRGSADDCASDYKGAAVVIDAFPKAKVLPGGKGCDADWFRAAVAGIAATAIFWLNR